MKTDTLVYVGGCAGSFMVCSGNRPVWDPETAGWIRSAFFKRDKYGGETTSFLIRHNKTAIFVDQGSGVQLSANLLRQMLNAEDETEVQAHVLGTHPHVDHIHGTPTNELLYSPDATLHFWSPVNDAYRKRVGSANPMPWQQHVIEFAYFHESGMYFPVKYTDLPSRHIHHEFTAGETFQIDDVTIKTVALPRHPGGCCGYRFEIPGVGAVVIATDNEPSPEPDPELVDFFDDTVLAFADMQYRQDEYEGERALGMKRSRKDWGHATPQLLFPTILACKHLPEHVVITHHDPKRSDSDLDEFHDYSLDVLRKMTGGDVPFKYQFAKDNDFFWL